MMRLGKRNFRHRLRYGFQPYFNKRGDRIPNPNSLQISIEEGSLPSWFLTPCKYLRLYEIWKRDYLFRFDKTRYPRVARTLLPNGLLILTDCLMVNMSYRSPSVPIIFETMVFSPADNNYDFDVGRYRTLREAREGHHEFVQRYRVYRLKNGS